MTQRVFHGGDGGTATLSNSGLDLAALAARQLAVTSPPIKRTPISAC
jgi:hypothetical protein